MTSTATDLTVAAWPDCAPRLLRPSQAGPEDHADYVQAGGYRPLTDADALLEQVDLSGTARARWRGLPARHQAARRARRRPPRHTDRRRRER